jgi:hypothetical protein
LTSSSSSSSPSPSIPSKLQNRPHVTCDACQGLYTAKEDSIFVCDQCGAAVCEVCVCRRVLVLLSVVNLCIDQSCDPTAENNNCAVCSPSSLDVFALPSYVRSYFSVIPGLRCWAEKRRGDV